MLNVNFPAQPKQYLNGQFKEFSTKISTKQLKDKEFAKKESSSKDKDLIEKKAKNVEKVKCDVIKDRSKNRDSNRDSSRESIRDLSRESATSSINSNLINSSTNNSINSSIEDCCPKLPPRFESTKQINYVNSSTNLAHLNVKQINEQKNLKSPTKLKSSTSKSNSNLRSDSQQNQKASNSSISNLMVIFNKSNSNEIKSTTKKQGIAFIYLF